MKDPVLWQDLLYYYENSGTLFATIGWVYSRVCIYNLWHGGDSPLYFVM